MDGVVKGLDDLFLEAAGARVCVDDGFALGRSELGKRNAKHVHLDAGGKAPWNVTSLCNPVALP